ncbi:MAG: hypothetical protein J6N21_15630 [Butyrivibrio sp.]|nr:hypothetical protein [Butyrivibrio sp.]
MRKNAWFLVMIIALTSVFVGCGKTENVTKEEKSEAITESTAEKNVEEKTETKKNYFKENRLIQTPDSVVEGITFVEEEDGYYTYNLGDSASAADTKVRAWMAYLMTEGYSVSDTNGNGTTFKVTKDGTVELIYAVGHLDYGYVIMISFS